MGALDPQQMQDYQSQMASQLAPEPGMLESAGAAMAGAIQSLPTTRAYQAFKRSQMGQGEPLLSPQELNDRYPNVEVPFNERLPDSVARDISQKQEFKQYLAGIVESGPKNVGQKILNFAAGTAPALIDPIFLGGAVATGGAAELAGVGSLLTAGEGAGLAQTALKGAAHAGASMLAPEALSGVLANQAHENYTLGDYVENVGGAAVFAGALHTLPPAVRFLKQTLGGKPDQMATTAATSQLLRGKNVTVDPIVSQMTGEMDGGVSPSPDFHSPLPPYEYKPLDTREPVTGKFYHGSERSLGGLPEVDHPALETDLGPGLYLTDNPQVANGVAARGLAEAPGKVIEAEIQGAKLLDLEQPLPEGLHPGSDPELPGKTVVGQMTPGELQTFEGRAQAAGYDGLRHQGGDFLGSDNAPHNVVKLFDPASPKVAETGQFEPNSEVTRQPGTSELQAISDHQQSLASDRLHDPMEHEEFQKLLDHPAEPWDVNEAKTTMDSEMESLRAIQDQGHLDQAGAAELERIQEDAKKDGMREQAWKSYMNCLVGNG